MTNVGITGNGRAFEYLLTILGSSELKEERDLASKIKKELDTTSNHLSEEQMTNMEKHFKNISKILKINQNQLLQKKSNQIQL